MYKQSYVTFTGCVWCYGNKKKEDTQHERCDLYMEALLSLYPHLRDCLFLCFAQFVTIQGWAVMDIQRTRTASETGTGRQFDTTQRHLVTAVVDKTVSVLFVWREKYGGLYSCSHTCSSFRVSFLLVQIFFNENELANYWVCCSVFKTKQRSQVGAFKCSQAAVKPWGQTITK